LGTIRHLIEWTSVGIEVLAVAVIVAAIVSLALTRGTVRYLLQRSTSSTPGDGENKPSLSKPLLMALELLVAADVLRTVVLEPTLYNVVALALLILVRTFLSWSMRVEIDGRWPWQSKVSVRDQKPQTRRDRILYNP
jgi:uncharacterized membrane protein